MLGKSLLSKCIYVKNTKKKKKKKKSNIALNKHKREKHNQIENAELILMEDLDDTQKDMFRQD